MVIENVMYLALGALVASLLALILMPAVWRRAVRLTKKRIEAATPMTMAEFRADKDQLRAQFALTTRRLEMTVEQLRKRITAQMAEANAARSQLAAIEADAEGRLALADDLRTRHEGLLARIDELEARAADLSQTLSQRDTEIDRERDLVRAALEAHLTEAGLPLPAPGTETGALAAALGGEAQRAARLEASLRALFDETGALDARTDAAVAALAALRDMLGLPQPDETRSEAEAHIAHAGSELTALLAAADPDGATDAEAGHSLAQRLSIEDEIGQLKRKVVATEHDVRLHGAADGADPAALRARLAEIASDVSRLVFAFDAEPEDAPTDGESLFDRVRRFADDGETVVPDRPAPDGRIAARLQAVRELRR